MGTTTVVATTSRAAPVMRRADPRRCRCMTMLSADVARSLSMSSSEDAAGPSSGCDDGAMTVAAVVLAAGGGSRFEGPVPKLLAHVHGEPLAVRAVRTALGAALDETIVVTGAVDLLPALTSAGLAEEVTLVANGHWAEGQATSLAAGIAAAERSGHAAVVVGLGDQPGVTAEAWQRVATASPEAAIVV